MQGTAVINYIGMDHKLNKAKLTILFEDKDILRQAEKLKYKKVDVKIKKYTKKRSLDANAYCWVLCDKIAKVVGNITKETVYRDVISNIGAFEPMIAEEKKFDKIKRIWECQGIGFLVKEILRKDKCVKFFAYYGSSTYDTKEMSLLIDWLVQMAKELEIDTKPEKEIKQLLENWAGTNEEKSE